MKIQLKESLPYATVSLTYQSGQIALENVLIDTGSGGTVFAADYVPEPFASPHPFGCAKGVGDVEGVFCNDDCKFNRVML